MENLKSLISDMIPLYNEYKQNKASLTGTEALEIMWEMGALIKKYIDKHEVAPHKLYRLVYGKAEGSTNIVQKSYIPREFQGRCYRIRNIFLTKEEIRKQLPTLRSFTCFREAMPFFDNKKYMLEGKEKQELLALLNSNLQPKEIVARLPKSRIDIRNPRTQRLHELEDEKDRFIKMYNFVYNILKQEQYDLIKKSIEQIEIEFIKTLAKNTAALARDGLKFFELSFNDSVPSPWNEYAILVKNFVDQKNPKILRRFRRLIPPERIVRLADMLYALLSKEHYNNFR
jgi:hypothetical protein